MTAAAYHINGPNFYGFAPDDGAPLAGGKLYTYEPGTTTLRATYTTEAADVANTNPVILNSAGYAAVHLAGTYRLKLLDANDVLVWDEDPVTQANIPDIYDTDTYAVDTGVADAYVVTLASWSVLTDGAGLWFKADNDSTGASTIDVSGLGVTPIKKDYNLPIEAGDIKEGGIYHLRYDGVNFQMVEHSSPVTTAELNRLDGISLTNPIITLPGGNVTPMLFYLDVAPLGWTILAAVDDHAVSLTKGSVASGIEGGTLLGTNVFSDQFDVLGEGLTPGVGDHTLTGGESGTSAHTHPSHRHRLLSGYTGGGGGTRNYVAFGSSSGLGDTPTYGDTDPATGDPYVEGTVTPASAEASADDAHGHSVDLDVARAHCIIASLD